MFYVNTLSLSNFDGKGNGGGGGGGWNGELKRFLLPVLSDRVYHSEDSPLLLSCERG